MKIPLMRYDEDPAGIVSFEFEQMIMPRFTGAHVPRLVKPARLKPGASWYVPSGICRIAPLSGALAADTSACGYTSPPSRTF
jgi:hypothetical protein